MMRMRFGAESHQLLTGFYSFTGMHHFHPEALPGGDRWMLEVSGQHTEAEVRLPSRMRAPI